ncbi:MAG: DUF2800 domain-containing protein [Oscillospiraceae bacterium]|nr:DUF2800 domain-containing protein [Oscillospiraceae bacterium]
MDIADLNLSVRAFNAVCRASIKTIPELYHKYQLEPEWLHREIGPKHMHEVGDALALHRDDVFRENHRAAQQALTQLTNNPLSGDNLKEDYHGNNSSDHHTDTDEGAASHAAGDCACRTCGTRSDLDGCTDCGSRPSPVCPCAAVFYAYGDVHDDCPLFADPGCAADARPDAGSTAADVQHAAARTGGSSAGGAGQAAGAADTAGGVRGTVDRRTAGGEQGGLRSTPESDGRADLMPGAHAALSPSAAHRWSHCTACLKLEQTIPDAGSPYAAEGTLAHRLAELSLQRHFDDIPDDAYVDLLEEIRSDPMFSPEMENYVGLYIDTVLGVCYAFLDPPYVVVEKRLDISHIAPECFGTADCIVISGNTLHVFDLKYGKGVPVSAEGNPQLRLYALGALRAYSLLYDIRTVTVHIVQPRLDNYSEETLTVDALTAWGKTIKGKAEEAYSGTGTFCAGEWCRFCKAKSVCRARAAAMLALEEPKQRMEQGETLTDDEIGGILLRAQTLENWVKGLETYAQEKLLAGGEIPGWKLVEGRSVRTITDTDKAFGVLTDSGYDSDLLYERKPLGLTALEKLCGKKKLAELIGSYITKPAGKPTLAPESDKRKALSKKKLEEMFKED